MINQFVTSKQIPAHFNKISNSNSPQQRLIFGLGTKNNDRELVGFSSEGLGPKKKIAPFVNLDKNKFTRVLCVT